MMTTDRYLRRPLILMLLVAAVLVLAQLVSWPPQTGLDRALTGFTAAAVPIAVSLTVYEWWQGRSRYGDRQE